MFKDALALLKARAHSREDWAPRDAVLGRDRRVFHRIPWRAACRINSRLFEAESAATAVNLSLGGVGLIAPVSWPEGSALRVWIDEHGFAANGIVCFRIDAERDFRYGVKFHRISVRTLFKLRRILRLHYQGPLTFG